MNKDFYAVVTGASSGIGKAIAYKLAVMDFNLILHSLPDQGLGNFCNELASTFKIKALHYEGDLTVTNGPELFYGYVRSKGCQVTILVNNAGIGFEGPIDTYSPVQIDNMILLNIRALTLLTFYFISELKKHEKSYILNISSFGCYLPTAYKSIYLASKSYIYYFTRALESELTGTNLQTCVLIPAAVRTNKVVLDRITRNGWFSKKSALDPEEVAIIGLEGMFKGRKVIIPGSLTNLFFYVGMFLPEGIMLLITRHIFRNYRQIV